MPALQFEPLWSGLSRPQTHDRAVSLLRAANVREQVVKMTNEYIYLVNGASLAEFRALGTSRTSFLSRPGTKGYIPGIPGLAIPLISAERLLTG